MAGNSQTQLSDGAYVQVTETSDQQHVLVDHFSAAGALLSEQRFDAVAVSYDFPTITATTRRRPGAGRP